MAKSMPRKFITKILLCFVACLLALGSAFPTMAYAEGETTTNVQYITKKTMTSDWLNKKINKLVGNTGFASGVEQNAIFGAGSTLRNIWINNETVLENMYNVIFSIGMSLTIGYFVIYLMQEMTEGRWNTDALIKALIKLVAVVWIMSKGFDIMETLIDLGAAIGTSIMNTAGSGNNPVPFVGQDFLDDMNADDATMITHLIGWAELLVPDLVMDGLCLYVQVQIYMRMIELYLRTFMAPLAIGDLYSGGPNPTAIRYLRIYMACALQGVIIVAILFCYRTISSSIATELQAMGILGNFILMFAVVGCIGKSNSFARELCGVG